MGLALDEPQENDTLEKINGINVSIDERVVDFTKDTTIDFQNTEQGPGLVFLGQNECC
ncbi:hypothetical protein MOJ78_17450 [Alkalihalobacillus sp. AL-G]|nr:hypothetical protein [Alkalihalobacillus sp. AL-G]WLD92774.1 hypothetical protein MOJ78_17450 [Alkalihalobacillus sp. AL-G]